MKYFSKYILILFVSVCLFPPLQSFAQSDVKSNKTYIKAVSYYNDNKVDKAIKTINPLLESYEDEAEVWEAAIAFYLKKYEDEYNAEQKQMTDQLMKALSGKSKNIVINVGGNSQKYYNDFLSICYKSTLKTNNFSGSMYLRKFLVDPALDTAVSTEAKELFQKAEDCFGKQDYGKALTFYDDAISKQPDYYHAILYKGDAYYFLKEYNNALIYFNKASEKYPDLLEPRKYVTDAYTKLKKYDDALNASMEAIIVYPDESMFEKFQSISDRLNKICDRHWIKRDFINRPGLIKSLPAVKTPWNNYLEAGIKISPYCDSLGIIKPNNLTTQKYLEVYCWEEMLKKTDDPKFNFAKQMQKEGYLDCYVFVSLFHYGFYDQYQDFAKNNKERIKKYLSEYVLK